MDSQLARKIDDIRTYAEGAEPIASEKGFKNPKNIVDALHSVADALELLAKSKA